MSQRHTIGALAQELGINVETVRYYQRRGLLEEPRRPPGGVRHYSGEHARRLHFIKEAQKLGFSLDEVGELLSLEDGLHCHEVEKIAGRKLETVRERMTQLRKMEKVLARLVEKCHVTSGTVRCPLIASLEGTAK